MRICHFTSAHKPNDIRIFHKECISLAEAGHEVFLVSSYSSEIDHEKVKFIQAAHQYTGRLSRMIYSAKSVYVCAKELNADVYHFHDPELLRFGLKLKRQGKKVIYDAHEDVPRQIMAKFWIPKVFRKLVSVCFEKYENYVAKRLTAIVVSTPHIKKRFIQINANTIDVCNYPLLSELLSTTDYAIKKNEICYVGGLSEVRGIHQLMDSLIHLKDVKLNLAGNFSGIDLEETVKSHESWHQVEFYGYVGRDQLLSIFQRSKIGMVTLLPTPNHMDSLPIKMFEYMSAGIPVICSDFPLWREIIEEGKCGVAVDPMKPERIAEQVVHLLENPALGQQMGENGRQAVLTKFNWDLESKKLLDLYHSI